MGRRSGGGSVYLTTRTVKGNSYEYWVAELNITQPNGKREVVRGFAPASLGTAAAQRLAVQRRNKNLQKRMGGAVAGMTEFADVGGVPVHVAPPPSAGVKLSALMERWLTAHDELAESGRQKYRRDFELHLLPWLDGDIAGLTEEKLRAHFKKVLPAAGRTQRSIYNAYAALKVCLNYAVSRRLILESPLTHVKVKRPKAVVREKDDKFIGKRVSMTRYMLRWLADEDQSGALHEHYPLILFMMLGLRRGELLGLEWSCVNSLERKGKATLVVKQQLHRSNGGRWFIHPETKNKQVRTIPLPELWRKALLEQKAKGYVAREDWALDLIFLQPPLVEGGRSRWTDYNTYNKIWHRVLEGYTNHRRTDKRPLTENEKWRPHAQRHVAASLLFDADVPLEVVQRILGHSDQAISAYYTHLLRSKKQEAVLTLESVLNAEPKTKVAARADLDEAPVLLTREQRELLMAVLAAQPDD